MKKQYLKILLLSFLGGYMLFCILAYLYPQLFFYNPSQKEANISTAHENSYPAQKVEYYSHDNTLLHAWYIAPKANKPTIVFMHGNSYNIEKFYHKLVPFHNEGYGTMIIEYRGFGGIKGQITQQGLAEDSKAAIKWLNNQGISNKDIILYGMSLGSYTSIYTAYTLGKEQSFMGLILEVPFDSLYAVAKDRAWIPLPLNYIIRDKYDNLSLITKLEIPILVMGAKQDKVVPISRTQNLYNHANKPKQLIIYPEGEHGNLYDYKNFIDILEWLKQHEKA